MTNIEHAQAITNKDETNTYKHNNNYNTPPKNIKHMRT
jgi:hypothetical protein